MHYIIRILDHIKNILSNWFNDFTMIRVKSIYLNLERELFHVVFSYCPNIFDPNVFLMGFKIIFVICSRIKITTPFGTAAFITNILRINRGDILAVPYIHYNFS